MDGYLDFAEDCLGGCLNAWCEVILVSARNAKEALKMKRKMKRILRLFNWWVVAGIVVLAILLGILNNLRVYEEQRVTWFGGPVVATEE